MGIVVELIAKMLKRLRRMLLFVLFAPVSLCHINWSGN